MWSNCLLNIPVWIHKFVLLPTYLEKLLIAVRNVWLFKLMKWSWRLVASETYKSTLPQLREHHRRSKMLFFGLHLAVALHELTVAVLTSQDTVKIKLTKFRHRLGRSWGFILTEELLAIGGCWEKKGHFSLGVWLVVEINPNLYANCNCELKIN